MRIFLGIALVAITVSFAMGKAAHAVCQQTGNTPDGGNVIDCPAPVQNTNINTSSPVATTNLDDILNIFSGGGVDYNGTGGAVDTASGDDTVNVSGLIHHTNNTALSTALGNDRIFINPGADIFTISGILIVLGGGDDFLQINGGILSTDTGPGIAGLSGNDTVELIDGTVNVNIVTGADDDTVRILGGSLNGTISTNEQNDTVLLVDGTFPEPINIDLGDDDDNITIANDFDNIRFIECREGFDTLTFAMDVPEDQVITLTNEIFFADPAGDSIEINGLTYEWIDCELLVADLNGVPIEPRPIPTLSQWGMIAMAGLIGIVGFIAVRRKKLAAI